MNATKSIIQRNLPLNVKYSVIDKKYIPLLDGFGQCCDNCGKLISHIATVKSENGVYHIGFDCMETFLLNNNLLDGFTLEDIEDVRKWITKTLRFSKSLNELFDLNKHLNITGVLFETPGKYDTHWITYYILLNGEKKSRNNNSVKIKELDFDFFIQSLKNIYPKLEILTQSPKNYLN